MLIAEKYLKGMSNTTPLEIAYKYFNLTSQ